MSGSLKKGLKLCWNLRKVIRSRGDLNASVLRDSEADLLNVTGKPFDFEMETAHADEKFWDLSMSKKDALERNKVTKELYARSLFMCSERNNPSPGVAGLYEAFGHALGLEESCRPHLRNLLYAYAQYHMIPSDSLLAQRILDDTVHPFETLNLLCKMYGCAVNLYINGQRLRFDGGRALVAFAISVEWTVSEDFTGTFYALAHQRHSLSRKAKPKASRTRRRSLAMQVTAKTSSIEKVGESQLDQVKNACMGTRPRYEYDSNTQKWNLIGRMIDNSIPRVLSTSFYKELCQELPIFVNHFQFTATKTDINSVSGQDAGYGNFKSLGVFDGVGEAGRGEQNSANLIRFVGALAKEADASSQGYHVKSSDNASRVVVWNALVETKRQVDADVLNAACHTTVCLATLHGQQLHTYTLGDSRFMRVQDGHVSVHLGKAYCRANSNGRQHIPYSLQLDHHKISPWLDEKKRPAPHGAGEYIDERIQTGEVIDVADGDIVVVATDGLWDNVCGVDGVSFNPPGDEHLVKKIVELLQPFVIDNRLRAHDVGMVLSRRLASMMAKVERSDDKRFISKPDDVFLMAAEVTILDVMGKRTLTKHEYTSMHDDIPILWRACNNYQGQGEIPLKKDETIVLQRSPLERKLENAAKDIKVTFYGSSASPHTRKALVSYGGVYLQRISQVSSCTDTLGFPEEPEFTSGRARARVDEDEEKKSPEDKSNKRRR